jgi:hypothetical protein
MQHRLVAMATDWTADRGYRCLPMQRALRLPFVLALTLSLAAMSAGSVAAAAPERDGVAFVASQGAGSQGPGKGPGGGPRTPHGYDISYPQCGGAYPANPLFGIVGVNGGRVYSTNPCLASELSWGGGAAAELYLNTGNPGPALSSFWPNGQASPRYCDAANNDTADCAYDYGWNAAAQSYSTVEQSYAGLGIGTNPSATAWWLDVETMNSWRSNTALNVAALQGQLDYLKARGVTRLGFYSTTVQWGTITGGTKVFAPLPSWGAGSPSEKAAKQLCATTVTSFTGGRLAMVQYIQSGFDVDIRC